ncbi:DNase I-like protein [Basidiobolus meristosporus CBS 931.73]|uniref:DNase I-like protein n=1 Tax=Basidiobolus meristosporus CBS 931.73 TaxID=1314790 RepID=A0A1Y1XYJ5_9FUNG|nr:DNase I-like protein [Basidiobolus meristosporus CBS 931.73]|eukprot:ORX90811.1 DNase I-like protein [Basidiobolus meristosporus CBS 931.73]
MASTLRVLTLNCWGLKFVSKKRKQRLEAIAHYLVEHDYDLVGLQEIWVYEDFEMVKHKTKHSLPYAHFFHTGIFGAGLAIFSKFPIVKSYVQPYSLNGNPLKILQGDWYVAKAVGCCHLEYPDGGIIEVYNTHLIAQYSPNDDNGFHRAAQGWELSRVLKDALSNGNHVIALGDYNSIPDNLVIKMIESYTGLTDSWDEINGSGVIHPPYDPSLSMVEIARCNGMTSIIPTNTLSGNPNQKHPGERLDYIFYARTANLRCTASQVCLTEPVVSLKCSYSDHFGVCSTFSITPKPRGAMGATEYSSATWDVDIFGELNQLLTSGLESVHRKNTGYIVRFAVGLIVWVILLVVCSIITPPSWAIAVFDVFMVGFAIYSFLFFLMFVLYTRVEDGAFRRLLDDLQVARNHAKLRNPL